MRSNEQHEDSRDSQSVVSRRTLIKLAAGAPMVITFGMLVSPLMRILKPTMKPGGFFQSSDVPTAKNIIEYNISDFPTDWTSKTFDFNLKYVVFNPEQESIHKIPGIVVRLSADEFVAYSRKCPNWKGCILNYKTEMCCGCVKSITDNCSCRKKRKNPVLVCPKHYNTFDLMQEGRIVAGPAPRPPWQFNVVRKGDLITIDQFESGIV